MDFLGIFQNQPSQQQTLGQNQRQNQRQNQMNNNLSYQQQNQRQNQMNFNSTFQQQNNSQMTYNNQANNRKNRNNRNNSSGQQNQGFGEIQNFGQSTYTNSQSTNMNQANTQENRGFFGAMTNTLGITTPPNNRNQGLVQNTTSENAVVLSNQNMMNLNRNNKKNNKNNQKNQEEERGFLNTITNAVGITETPKEINKRMNTHNLYKSINTSKKHYFIGYMINNEKQIQDLIQIQNKLITRYKMRKFYKNWDQKFVSRYVYMGYLTPEVAQKYMDRLMKDLCEQISNKFSSLVCKYKKISPKFDKSINWVSISYDDENEYLSKIIIPFLDKYGIKPIFPNRKTIYLPLIDIIHFKQSSLSKQDVIDIPIPNDTFTIDHISLLSGKPTQSKIGGQSIHDRLAYEEEGKYYFPLKI